MDLHSVTEYAVLAFAAVGVIGTALTSIGALLPPDSVAGQWCSRVGTDLRWVAENARK